MNSWPSTGNMQILKNKFKDSERRNLFSFSLAEGVAGSQARNQQAAAETSGISLSAAGHDHR